jgi:hypothetical protein
MSFAAIRNEDLIACAFTVLKSLIVANVLKDLISIIVCQVSSLWRRVIKVLPGLIRCRPSVNCAFVNRAALHNSR